MCLVCSAQAVMAAEADTNGTKQDFIQTTDVDDVASNSSVTLLSNDNQNGEDVLNDPYDGTFTGLNELLDDGSSEYTLQTDYAYTAGDSDYVNGIVISRNITINGNGKTIDGSGQARIFNITTGYSVTLNGVTFINGHADYGGAIYSDGILTMDNCIFKNNDATYDGGAIYLEAIPGTLSNLDFTANHAGHDGGAIYYHEKITGSTEDGLIGSNFTNNTAGDEGGALYIEGMGGIIRGSTFIGNNATVDGGAIMIKGTNWRVYGSTFRKNNAVDRRGGAIYLENSHYSYIEDSTFEYNVAGTNGGAIDWHDGADHGNIIGCTFNNNTAKRSGGAVFWFGTNGTIKHSTFTGNDALGQVEANDSYGNMTYGGFGGAIMWTGAIGDIINSTFRYNEAHYNADVNYGGRGGAIYLQGSTAGNCTDTTFNNCTFIGNIAGTNGGAIDWHEGAHDGLINNSNFEDNIAYANGGAVYWRGHHGDIYNSNFTGNVARGERKGSYGNIGDGGAIAWAGVNGTVVNCRFIDNKAINNGTTDSGRGGAVYLQACEHGNENTTFRDCYFYDNNAGTNGGALYWHEGAKFGYVDNCTFDNNIANRSAAAIFWIGTDGTIINSVFTNNQALGKVSANVAHTSGVQTTGGSGGAIIWAGSHGTINNTRFTNNSAAKRGGAVFLEGTDNGTEKIDCTDVKFKNCTFTDNIAEINGGAIAWDEGARDGVMDNCTFINNTARANGGAIFWNGHNGKVSNSIFINNRATGKHLQYDMDLTYDNVVKVASTINETQFLSVNPDQSDVGKLYVLNYTDPNNASMLIFKSYVAHNNSGTLEWKKLDETTVRVDDEISPVDWGIDQFFGGDGGTILWSGDVGEVYNCTFEDSNSARRGGGAYMTGSDYITFNLCTFTDCTSGTNGGGLDWLAGANHGKVYNCNFTDTRAARSAGAIYYDGDDGDMQNITITHAVSYGGALASDRGVNYAGWDSSHWDTNTTGGDGGAIMITGNRATLYNVTFTDCISSGRGGAIFLQDDKNVTIDLCVFENNRANGTAQNTFNNDSDTSSGFNQFLTGYGGALCFDYGAEGSVIKNSKFIQNTAVRIGGAIAFSKGSKNAEIYNCEFTDNVAYRSGGAISWDGENGNMSW